MTKPWTAIVREKSTGMRTSVIFDGSFGSSEAANDFKQKYGIDMKLEALIPGSHTSIHVEKV